MMSRRALRQREDDPDAAVAPSACATHVPAVEQVVATMRERLGETLTLHDMADVAHLSPYYFIRVFHDATGIPPAAYLAALRVQEAKRLLLTTEASVADVCFEVGYTGLGTFTARFARLVGLPPGRLRRQADDVDGIVTGAQPFGGIAQRDGVTSDGVSGVTGVVQAPDATLDDAPGLIFIGLFPTPIPQSTPVGSALLEGPGTYHIPCVPDGRYYAMAAAFPAKARGQAYLLPGDGLRVGQARVAVTVRGGRARERADIVVRPPRPTAPPLLTALPFLLLDHQRPT